MPKDSVVIPDPDTVTIRRGLLVALTLTAAALCRKVNPDRIAHCREILKTIDDEIFTPERFRNAVPKSTKGQNGN